MRSRFSSIFVCVFVAAILGAPLRAQDPVKIQIRTAKIADGLFMLAGAGANIGASIGEDGVLLIDDGVVPAVDKVKAALAKLDARPPQIVLNTNWHYDHADGNEAFAAQGAVVVAHRLSRPHMLAEQRITELEPVLVIPPYRRGALPAVTIDESSAIHFNGDDIAAIHVPTAHSDGDLAYYFRKANVLFTGDLFFPAGTLFIHYSGGGTVAGTIRAADRILAMTNEQTRIVPGHGPVCGRADVGATRDFLVAIRDRVQTLLAKGQSVEQVVAANPLQDLFKGRSEVPPARWARLVYEELARDEKAAIAKVITDSICWALTKDRALAESTLAHDEDLFYFWTNSTFTVNGWKQHLKYFDTWMDPRFKAVRTEVRDLRVHLSRSGDVAWYAATLDDVVEFDGKRGGGEDIRWTGVLEKRDGKWVIVQMHASLAADKVLESAKKDGR
jgi:cyclase